MRCANIGKIVIANTALARGWGTYETPYTTKRVQIRIGSSSRLGKLNEHKPNHKPETVFLFKVRYSK